MKSDILHSLPSLWPVISKHFHFQKIISLDVSTSLVYVCCQCGVQISFLYICINGFASPCVCVCLCVLLRAWGDSYSFTVAHHCPWPFSLSSTAVTASPTSASSQTMAPQLAPLRSWHQAWWGICQTVWWGHSKRYSPTPSIRKTLPWEFLRVEGKPFNLPKQ